MDMNGAVDLMLPTTTLRLPLGASASDFARLERRSEAQWGDPYQWRQLQLARLAAASALEARLLHVQGNRLSRYGLSRDPERVTLAQLAGLVRSHHGTAGQAFELAVADAIEEGVPEVVEPVTEALRRLGVRDAEEVRMLVLGLEKVPREVAVKFYADLGEMLPTDARLHTGRSGARAHQQTVLRRLAEATWATLRDSDAEHDELRRRPVSQLGRADALLYTPTALVPASLKINSSYLDPWGWRDVPVWITTAGWRGGHTVRRVDRAQHPTYAVELGSDEWLPVFKHGLEAVDLALAYADKGRQLPRMHPFTRTAAGPIARRMVQLADMPIADIVRQLRAVDPLVTELFAERTWTRKSDTEVSVLDAKPLVNAWRQAAEDAAVIRGQQHLFYGKADGVNRPAL